jgi:hypothetical protein
VSVIANRSTKLMPERTNSWYLAVNTEKKDFSSYVFAVPDMDAGIRTAPFRAQAVYIIIQLDRESDQDFF